ncbi:MAG: FecR domain-containing protein [Odoribacteraceae bacterium]|jgi:ferric-dicitrate binding protein FerR (iron transport regulator)|nr:FecR domain-containing protein [Odoribacteraceae bacterium]
MEIPELIEDIIEKTLQGKESDFERRQLDGWLQASPEHRKLYRKFVKVYDLGRYALKWNTIIVESAWSNITGRYLRVGRRRRRRAWFSVAASLLVLVGLYFLFVPASFVERDPVVAVIPPGESKAILKLSDGRQLILNKGMRLDIDDAEVKIDSLSGSLNYAVESHDAGEMLFHEVLIPVGGEFHLILSDGTLVYLNAASRLRFPVHFPANGPREVMLVGEAYFDVERDPSSPFVVHTQEMEVRVLGTDFNVMAYDDDARVEVTLVHGEVSVLVGEEERTLLPSQQLVMDRQKRVCSIKSVDKVDAYVNWKNGVLDFDAMPLDELTAKLSRWYNVEFYFADERLKALQFTGAVRKYENIDYILGLIGATTDVVFEIDKNVITVANK